MNLKQTRNELLKDNDSLSALDFAVKKKMRQDPQISRESILDGVILPIAYHESRLDPKAKQFSGGPARGLMQFEPASLRTAAKRAQIILTRNGEEVPAFINKIIDNKIMDASTLTSGQQTALAVYDLLEKPDANITNITANIQHVKWFWADFWWAGKREDRINRMASFTESYKDYLMEYRNNIQKVGSKDNPSLDTNNLWKGYKPIEVEKGTTQVITGKVYEGKDKDGVTRRYRIKETHTLQNKDGKWI